jgi:nucleoredoxin
MRTFVIFLAVVLVALVCYPYVRSGSPQSGAGSQISTLIQGNLVSADGSPFSFPANAPASSIQYYAIYYSAQWCPPCHAFTPVLVEWYQKFKPSHPNFELIFVSDDHDQASMLAYMQEMAMPWPAFQFDELKHDGKGIEKFAGDGIPDLVLVDAGGKVLSDSFSWTGSYLGPQHVLNDIEKLVGGT